jgi:uncharacterized protein (DUF4415 family)
MKGEPMKKPISRKPTARQRAELKALARLPDRRINTAATPEQKDWRGAKRGVFFRPVKKQLTLRLDADVIDWFRTRARRGKGYQTQINQALRDYVVRHEADAD